MAERWEFGLDTFGDVTVAPDGSTLSHAQVLRNVVDEAVLNEIDRFSLVSSVIERVPELSVRAAYAKQAIRDKLIEHRRYVSRHGEDMPEIRNWRWTAA